MKVKQQNLTQAATILLFATVLVKLIGALFKIPLSSDYALGDLGFGYFSAVYDFFIPVTTLCMSGFPVAIAGMVADKTAKNRPAEADKIFVIAHKVLTISGAVAVLLVCAFSVPIVKLTDKSGNSLYSLWAIAPSVFFCFVASVYRGYFEGYKNMVPTAVSNVIEALGKLILGLTLAIITIRLTGNPAVASAAALLGITAGTLFSLLYLSIKFRRQNRRLFADYKDAKDICESGLFKQFLLLSIPVAIASLCVNITSFIDSLTLRVQLSHLIADNQDNVRLLLKGTLYGDIAKNTVPTLIYGIRGKAHTLFNLIPTLTIALGVGAIPLITECFVKGDRENLKKNTNMLLKLSAVISFPAAAGFAAVGGEIMRLLYGKASAELGGRLLALYGVAALFAGLCVPMTYLLQATKLEFRALLNILCGIVVKIILNLILTRVAAVNVYGTVIATSACYAVIFLLNTVTLISAFHLVPDIAGCFAKPFFASLLCAAGAFAVCKLLKFSFSILLAIIFAAFVYVVALILLKAFKHEELAELIKKA
ncbi:MAG: oligosaccharide flippase family protein [Acutalibacteraceae bacterium]|jgi:stage V sporulation protein B